MYTAGNRQLEHRLVQLSNSKQMTSSAAIFGNHYVMPNLRNLVPRRDQFRDKNTAVQNRSSLVPRPFPPPVFDTACDPKTGGGNGLGTRLKSKSTKQQHEQLFVRR